MHAPIAGIRRTLGLALLLAAPEAAADMAPDDGKDAIYVEPRFDGLEKFSDRVFVLTPIACSIEEPWMDYAMLPVAPEALEREAPQGYPSDCERQTLYALPRADFPVVDGKLPAFDALTPEQRNARVGAADVLHAGLGDPEWRVPTDNPVDAIYDHYAVAITDGKLVLTPVRVEFGFVNASTLIKDYKQGKRPRIPRASEMPPDPPPEPEAAAPPPTPPAPPPVAASTPVTPPPAAATPPAPVTTAAPATPPAVEPAPAEPDAPRVSTRTLALGGGCLLLALVGAFALRRGR